MNEGLPDYYGDTHCIEETSVLFSVRKDSSRRLPIYMLK